MVVGWSPVVANADLPPDRVVTFQIRETPADPQSDVVWTVRLSITATTVHDNTVGWAIEELSLEEQDDNFSPHRQWIEEWPIVNSPDGLWRVYHGDPVNPLPSEFSELPLVGGVASTAGLGTANLGYQLEGMPSPGDPQYEGNVSKLTFSFALEGEVGPLDDGEDEPVEIADEEDPPLGGS